MTKIFMVWERESFDNYGVIFVTESKADALKFITDLTGEVYDNAGKIDNGNVPGVHTVDFVRRVGKYNSKVDSEVWLEERELNQYEPLSI